MTAHALPPRHDCGIESGSYCDECRQYLCQWCAEDHAFRHREDQDRSHATAPDRQRRADFDRDYTRELIASIRMAQFKRGTAR